MTLLSPRRSHRRRRAGLGASVALVLAMTALIAACGGSSKANVKAAVQVMGQNASQVAAGQSVTLVFVKLPAGVSPGTFGSGSGRLLILFVVP